jgi:hypothetical protein
LSHYQQTNNLVVDAGALALSKDLGAAHVVSRVLQSNEQPAAAVIASKWGYVVGHPTWDLASITQELGVIHLPTDESVWQYNRLRATQCIDQCL